MKKITLATLLSCMTLNVFAQTYSSTFSFKIYNYLSKYDQSSYDLFFNSHNMNGVMNPEQQNIFCYKDHRYFDNRNEISYKSSDGFIKEQFIFSSHSKCLEVVRCMNLLGNGKAGANYIKLKIEKDTKKIIGINLSVKCTETDPWAHNDEDQLNDVNV
jgi:hypothetical protein